MNIAVYCGSNFGNNPAFAAAATELGTWMGQSGHNLVYGGSSVGLMGLVSRAVLDAGAKAIGVEPAFFLEQGIPQHEDVELRVVETMSERKAMMIELADAFVALPGGVGTLEEIIEIMSRIHLELGQTDCYLLNVEGYWDDFRAMLQSMSAQGFVSAADLDHYHFPATVGELAELLG